MRTFITERVICFTEFKRKHPRLIMAFLVFILVPVVSSALLGYEMKADVSVSIPTVVIDNDNSAFSKEYIQYIEDSETFRIEKYADNYQDMENDIYQGKAYAGVIIPENFSKDLLAGVAPKILTVYDGSTMAVIVSSKASMMETLLTVKAGYMAKIFEGKQSVVPGQVMNQVMPISTTFRTLYNPSKSFRNFILPGLLAAIVQVSMAITGAERGYENQRKEMTFMKHLKSVLAWSTVGVMSIVLCLSVQWIFFGMPFRGTIMGGLLLTFLFSMAITLMGYVLGSFFDDRAFCTQISCILVLPTAILGGYTWPVLAMPTVVQYIVKVIPFTYYGEAVRNLCLKPIEFRHILPEMFFMLGFILVELIGLALVKHRKNGMRGDHEICQMKIA